MFTVKAEFHGHEFRRCTFEEFPSFEQLQSRIVAWYPITSPNFSLRKLLLSPDVSQPASRVLLSHSVSNASEYDDAIAPYTHRRWPNPLLRFTVQDQPSMHKLPSSASLLNLRAKMLQQAPVGSLDPLLHRQPEAFDFTSMRSESRQSFLPPPLQSTYVPFHQSSPSISTFSNQVPWNDQQFHETPDTNYFGQARPRPQQVPQSAPLSCGTSTSQPEIDHLLSQLKLDILRIVDNSPPRSASAYSSHTPGAPMPHQLRDLPNLGTGPIHLPPLPPAPPVMTMSDSYWPAPQHPPPGMIPPPVAQWMPYSYIPPTTLPPVHGGGFGGSPRPTSPQTPSELHTSRNGVPFSWGTPMPAPDRPVSTITTERSQAETIEPAPQSPLPVHTRIICDFCDQTIVGIRHKCLDCPDFDLCTECITNSGPEAHNPFHEFFEISKPGHVIVHTVFSGQDERDAPPPAEGFRTVSPSPVQEIPSMTTDVHSATCDLCDSRVVGPRYKCLACPDFDTCAECFQIVPEQHPGHPFVRIHKQEDYIMKGQPEPERPHFSTCNSCGKLIHGIRFKCMGGCEDYDLCANCESMPIPVHPTSHPMLKIRSAHTVIPTVVPPGHVVVPSAPARLRPTSRGSVSDMYTSRPSSVASETPSYDIPREQSPPLSYDPAMEPICSGRLFNGNDSPHRIPSLFDPPSSECSPSLSPSHFYRGNSPPPRLPPVTLNDFSAIGSCNPFATRPPSVESMDPKYPVLVPYKETCRSGTSDCRVSFDEDMPTLPTPPSDPPVAPVRHTRHSTLTLSELLEQSGYLPPSSPPQVQSVWEDSPLANDEALLTRPHFFRDVTTDTEALAFTDPFTVSKRSSLAALLNADGDSLSVLQETSFPLVPDFKPSFKSTPVATISPALTTHSRSQHADSAPLQATFIRHVTVPEAQVFPPGAEFRKVWRLGNNGTRAWPEDVQLVFVAGTSMSPDDVHLPVNIGAVAPGHDIEVSTADLKAPDQVGHYYSYWRLSSGRGELFGQDIWIDIVVAEMDGSDSSLSASAVIMPNIASNPPGSMTSHRSVSGDSSKTSTTFSEALSDTGSDVSIVSGVSSDGEWQSLSGSPSQYPTVSGDEQNIEYVMLFDEHDTESE